MAKLRGETGRLQINTAAADADPVWNNIAGEMGSSISFGRGTIAVDTKDNKSGWSQYQPTPVSGTIDLTVKYPIEVENSGDLVYKDFFTRSAAKTEFDARIVTSIFTLNMKLIVLSLDINAANQDVVEYSVSLGYVEKPKFAKVT